MLIGFCQPNEATQGILCSGTSNAHGTLQCVSCVLCCAVLCCAVLRSPSRGSRGRVAPPHRSPAAGGAFGGGGQDSSVEALHKQTYSPRLVFTSTRWACSGTIRRSCASSTSRLPPLQQGPWIIAGRAGPVWRDGPLTRRILLVLWQVLPDGTGGGCRVTPCTDATYSTVHVQYGVRVGGPCFFVFLLGCCCCCHHPHVISSKTSPPGDTPTVSCTALRTREGATQSRKLPLSITTQNSPREPTYYYPQNFRDVQLVTPSQKRPGQAKPLASTPPIC